MIVDLAFSYLAKYSRRRSSGSVAVACREPFEVVEVEGARAPVAVRYRDGDQWVVLRHHDGDLYARMAIADDDGDPVAWVSRTLQAQPASDSSYPQYNDPFGRLSSKEYETEDPSGRAFVGFYGETSADMRARALARLKGTALLVDGVPWVRVVEPKLVVSLAGPLDHRRQDDGTTVAYEARIARFSDSNHAAFRLDQAEQVDELVAAVAVVPQARVTLPEFLVVDPAALRFPSEGWSLRLTGLSLLNEMAEHALEKGKAHLNAYVDLRDACEGIDFASREEVDVRHDLAAKVAAALIGALDVFKPKAATLRSARAVLSRWDLEDARYRADLLAREGADDAEVGALMGM